MVGRDQLVFRVHAVLRMIERHIAVEDVLTVVNTGEMIEDYPTDTPYPSRLTLGHVGPRPLHVVWADGPDATAIIVTAYEPHDKVWESGFRVRR